MTPRDTFWAIHLGHLNSVGVRLHFSVVLLAIWWLLAPFEGSSSTFLELSLVFGVFLSLLAHELAHVVVASKLHLTTNEITVYPFGGISTTAGKTRPSGEAMVALAGPAANALLAALFLFISPELAMPQSSGSTASEGLPGLLAIRSVEDLLKASVALRLAAWNLALFAINLIPAIPLDGARALQAVLSATRVPRPSGVVAKLSMLVSLSLFGASIYLALPLLALGSGYLVVSGIRALLRENTAEALAGKTVRDAMIPRDRLVIFPHSFSVTQAYQQLLYSHQSAFPVVAGDTFLGLVERERLLQAAVSHEGARYINEISEKNLPVLGSADDLPKILELLEQASVSMLPVNSDGVFVGAVFRDRLIEYALVTAAKANQPPHDETQDDLFF